MLRHTICLLDVFFIFNLFLVFFWVLCPPHIMEPYVMIPKIISFQNRTLESIGVLLITLSGYWLLFPIDSSINICNWRNLIFKKFLRLNILETGESQDMYRLSQCSEVLRSLLLVKKGTVWVKQGMVSLGLTHRRPEVAELI